MYKEKEFRNTRFSADVLRRARQVFIDSFNIATKDLEYGLNVTIGEVW